MTEREALQELVTAAHNTLATIDAHNEKHGTFWVGPGFLQLAIKIAQAEVILNEQATNISQ